MEETLQETEVKPVIEQTTKSSHSWAYRTLSALKKDSLQSSIFTMLMSAIGLGVFTLHKLFHEVGLLAGALLVVLYGLFYVMSSEFLMHSSKMSVHSKSLNELVRNFLGDKYLAIYSAMFFVSTFSCLVAQNLTISEILYNNFGELIFEMTNILPENKIKENFFYYCSLALGGLMFLVHLSSPADKLGLASMVSLSIYCGTILVVIWQVPEYYQINQGKLNVLGFTWHGFFHRGGLLIFAFNCLFNFYTVKNNLANPSLSRMRKVFHRTYFVLVLMSIIIGFVFYLSLGPLMVEKVDLFINRPAIGQSDIAMIMSRSCLMVSLLIESVLTIEPLKNIFAGFLSNRQNYIFSALFFSATPALIASRYRNINSVIGISGALFVTFLFFTTPGILAFKTGFFRKKWQNWTLLVWISVTFMGGVYGSFLNLQDFRNVDNRKI